MRAMVYGQGLAFLRWGRLHVALAAPVAILFAFALVLPRAAQATPTFEVASTADVAAEDPTTGCATPAASAAKGDCTLRSALQAANSAHEGTVSVPAGHYDLTLKGGAGSSGSLVIDGAITLTGAGASSTVIDGGGEHGIENRVILIAPQSVARISGVTIEGGYVDSELFPFFFYDGAGVATTPNSTVTIEDAVITNNYTGAEGGGIADVFSLSQPGVVKKPATPTATTDRSSHRDAITAKLAAQLESPALTIIDSTISHNSANYFAGGVLFQAGEEDTPSAVLTDDAIADNKAGSGGGVGDEGGFLSLLNDTITANEASGFEGDHEIQGGEGGGMLLSASGEADITNATIDSNSAVKGLGGNLESSDRSGYFNLKSTIVAYGKGKALEEGGSVTPESDNANCEGEAEPGEEATFLSLGHNLQSGQPTELGGCFASSVQPTDLYGANPLIGPLQGNGGPTETQALLTGSPAIAAIPAAACTDQSEPPVAVTSDQRGVTRPQKGACDIGAYQTVPVEPEAKKETETKQTTPKTAVAPSVTVAAPKQCASLRVFPIHIQHVNQLHLVWAQVYLNGRLRKTLHPGHMHAVVNLRDLPPGTFTVTITAHQRNGRVLHGKRTYHTCREHPLPGHKYLHL